MGKIQCMGKENVLVKTPRNVLFDNSIWSFYRINFFFIYEKYINTQQYKVLKYIREIE